MSARGRVVTSLVVCLAATGLVAVGSQDRISAQAKKGPVAGKDPGNSPKPEVKPERPPIPAVVEPRSFEEKDEEPKGSGSNPSWFLKTDPASRSAAKDAAKRAERVSTSSGPSSLDAGPVDQATTDRILAIAPTLPDGNGRALKASSTRKAARGPLTILPGQPAARTSRKLPAESQKKTDLNQANSPVTGPAAPGREGKNSSVGPGGGPALVPSGGVETVVQSEAKKSLGSAFVPIKKAKKEKDFVETNGQLRSAITGGAAILSDSDDPAGAIRLELTPADGGLQRIGLVPIGATKSKPTRTVDGSGKWSKAVSGGHDLVERATEDGVKGEIVLERAVKNPVWDFELVLSDGLTPSFGDELGVPDEFRPVGVPIKIRNVRGEVVAEVPAGLSVDASGSESANDLALRAAADGRWVVSIGVDAAWLEAADRSFPVRVDPTITRPVTGGTLRTLIEGSGSSNAAGFTQMISDRYWGYDTQVSFSKFDLSGLTNATINSASLQVSVSNCDAPYTPGGPYGFQILAAPTASPWDPATLTTANRPSVGPAIGAYPANGATISYNFTNDVAWWAKGNGTPGFQIRTQRTSANFEPNYCNVTNIQLVIDQTPGNNPATGSIVAPSPANAAVDVVNNPTFAASGSDPDGQAVSYYFDYCLITAGVCGPVTASGWQSASTWTPTLSFGAQYQWRAWVWDGIGANTFLGQRTFTTKTRTNRAPVGVNVSPAANATAVGTANGSTVSVTLTGSGSDPDGDPIKYWFRVYDGGTYLAGNVDLQASPTFTFQAPYGRTLHWITYVQDEPPAGGGAAILAWAPAYQYLTTIQRPNAGPTVPTLGGVDDAATLVAQSPTLTATSTDPNLDTVRYRFSVCTDAAAVTCPFVSPWTTSSWAPTLAYGTKYWWTAEAIDEVPAGSLPAVQSSKAPVRSFQTQPNPTNAVTAPVVVGPVNGMATTTRPYLGVNAVDADGDAVEYAFQICSPDFPGVAATPQCFSSPWVANPSWQPPENLNWGKQYKWRAWARNTANATSPGIVSTWVNTLTPAVPSVAGLGPLSYGWAPHVTYEGEPEGAINEALGAFTSSAVDAAVVTVGPAVNVQRTYNSTSRMVGVFGRGWSSNIDMRLYEATTGTINNPVIIVMPDGRREYYSQDQNGKYQVSKTGTFADLSQSWDASPVYPACTAPAMGDVNRKQCGWKYTLPDLTHVFFDRNGLLVKMIDNNGMTVTYTRDAAGRVTSIDDARSGRKIMVTYDANGRISATATPAVAPTNAPLTWTYAYTGELLTQVCPPTSATVTGCHVYEYFGDRISVVKKPKGNTDVSVTYNNVSAFGTSPTLNVNGSFEDPTVPAYVAYSCWYTCDLVPGAGVTTAGGGAHGGKSFLVKRDPARLNQALRFYAPLQAVEPGRSYSFSAMTKGNVGKALPYYVFFDSNYRLVSYGWFGADGDGGAVSSPMEWRPIRGTVRVPENAAFGEFHLNFFEYDKNAGDVYVDAVAIEKGDGTLGRVATRTDGMGNTATFSYIQNGQNLEVGADDPRPTVGASKTIYNARNEVIEEIDVRGRSTKRTYDSNGYLADITDHQQRKLAFTNDDRGNVTAKTFKSAAGATIWQESATFAAGTSQMVNSTDRKGNVTNYGYDNYGALVSKTYPGGGVDSWAYTIGTEPATYYLEDGYNYTSPGYQPARLLKSQSDRTGVTRTMSYDALGNLQLETVGGSYYRIQHGYDTIGRRTSSTRLGSALSQLRTTYEYDVRSRLVRETLPPSVVGQPSSQLRREYGYDANGNNTQVWLTDLSTNTTRTTTIVYDNNDRAFRTIEPNNEVSELAFDEVGNVKSTSDQRGLVTYLTYNDLSQPVDVQLANYVGTNGSAGVRVSHTDYDVLDRVSLVTDALNRQTRTTYTDEDRVQSVSQLGYSQVGGAVRDVLLAQYEYDKNGNITKSQSGSAAATGMRVIANTYDNRDFLISTTLDPGGLNRTTTFTPDAAGRPKIETTGDFVRQWNYTAIGQVQDEIVGGIGTTTYTYDAYGNVTNIKNPRGYTSNFYYDLYNRQTLRQLPQFYLYDYNGYWTPTFPTTQTTYNAFGDVTKVVDPNNNTTTMTYDARGRRTSTTYPTVGAITPTETWSYEPNTGNLLASTDRRGATTNYAYDLVGRMTRQTSPPQAAGGGRIEAVMTFNDAGEVVRSLTRAAGGTAALVAPTSYTYDRLGRVQTSVTEAVGGNMTTRTEYDDLGNMILSVDPALGTRSTVFNAASQPTRSLDEQNVPTDYTYTATTGRLESSVINSTFGTWNTYDTGGRMTTQKTRNVANTTVLTTSYEYDANSNVTKVTRPNGGYTVNVYGVTDWLTSTSELLDAATGESRSVTSRYDANGNRTNLSDPEGRGWTKMYYNAWNQLSKTTDLFGQDWTVTYDKAGMPASETRPGGVTVNRSYNDWNMLLQETGSGGADAAPASRSFTYDSLGRMATEGGQSFTYDDRSLLTSSSGPAGASNFSYDGLGRLTQRVDAAGTTGFAYTARSELKQVTLPSGVKTDLTWRPTGEAETIKYGTTNTRTFGYDPIGRLADDHLVSAANATLTRRQHTYSTNDGPDSTTITRAGATTETHHFGYDAGGRLRSFNPVGSGQGSVSYTYDKAGNRKTAGANTYTYDGLNRLTGAVANGASKTFTWSPRGTLTGIVGEGTYTYDALDRLTGSGSVGYTYDSLDRVLTRTASGLPAGSFKYAAAETDPVDDGTTKYQRSPSGQLIGQTSGTVNTFVGTERHGDVAWTLNQTTGALADTITREPWGKPLTVTGTPAPTGFQSDWTDPLTGNVWMAARWYSPRTGTFLSRDTYAGEVGAIATLNRFSYGINNPIAYWDPSGHRVCSKDFESDCTLDGRNNHIEGTGNKVNGRYNTVIGNDNTVNGTANRVKGNDNSVNGDGNTIKGNGNKVWGDENGVKGKGNDVLGSGNSVNGDANTLIGFGNAVSGSDNFAIGFGLGVVGNDNTAVGRNFTVRGNGLSAASGISKNFWYDLINDFGKQRLVLPNKYAPSDPNYKYGVSGVDFTLTVERRFGWGIESNSERGKWGRAFCSTGANVFSSGSCFNTTAGIGWDYGNTGASTQSLGEWWRDEVPNFAFGVSGCLVICVGFGVNKDGRLYWVGGIGLYVASPSIGFQGPTTPGCTTEVVGAVETPIGVGGIKKDVTDYGDRSRPDAKIKLFFSPSYGPPTKLPKFGGGIAVFRTCSQ